MTAETLKPFITPTSAVDSFPANRQSSGTHLTQRKTTTKSKQLLPTVFLIAALALVIAILGLTIWQTLRVSQAEKDLKSLKRVVDSLQQRLGIHYLEDIDEFQKEYENALIEDPSKLDAIESEDDDDDDDDDDGEDEDDDDGTWSANEDDEDSFIRDYPDYADIMKNIHDFNEEESETASTTASGITPLTHEETDTSASSASNDDDVFQDFTSYIDSKKKRERKSRSIASNVGHEVQTYQSTNVQNKTQEQDKEQEKEHKSAPPQHNRRRIHRRPRVLLRKGESFISAKSTYPNESPMMLSRTPAAHFHLHRKVAHHQAPIQVSSYQGDMYIGHAPDNSDNNWQQHFKVINGVLTVNQKGLYYIYAQICYNNTHDQNGFIIFHGQNAFLQCLNTVPTNMPQKIHTCHTSGLIELQENESIHLRDIHRDRNVMLRDSNNRSYFGIIKL